MIKRTIEISSGPTHLSIRNAQLIVEREHVQVGTIPCEDIGLVIVDHPAVTYTQGVLTSLADNGAIVVVCGKNHHPAALVTPLSANTVHTERLRVQVESTRPVSKRIWKQLVRAKIRAQADVLARCCENPSCENSSCENPFSHADVRESLPAPQDGNPAEVGDEKGFSSEHTGIEPLLTQQWHTQKLLALADEVRSGDPTNIEAQAARIYSPALLGKEFRRDSDGSPPNNLLNYGYMAVRAAVARAVCGAGLHPSIGLHHRNRYNPFCLADDLVEPFRPMVDERVLGLWREGKTELDKEVKAVVLGVLTDVVTTGDERGPLQVSLARMMASLVRVFEGTAKRLEIPVPSADRALRSQPK